MLNYGDIEILHGGYVGKHKVSEAYLGDALVWKESDDEIHALTFCSPSGAQDLTFSGTSNLECSHDLENWEPYIPGTKESFGKTLKLYVRGRDNTKIDGSFQLYREHPTEVSGNIMHLLDYNASNDALPTDKCFWSIFEGCDYLYDARELKLPAMTLTPLCYCQMFKNCKDLKFGPSVLPAKHLTDSCYHEMFSGCSSLTNKIIMNAETVESASCKSMFENCTALEEGPSLMAEEGALTCYGSMFSGCSNMRKIVCNLRNPEDNVAVRKWTVGTGSDISGVKVFYKAPGVDWPEGDSGIPEGWEVYDI